MTVALLVFLAPFIGAQTCPEGEYWVSSHSRRAYVRADGVVVSATSVNGHCREKSKVESHWGPRLKGQSPKIWEHKSENFKPWTVEEKIRFFEAMGFLPEALWLNLKDIEFHRATDSVIPKNPGSSLKHTIVLYDLAFEEGQNLARVIAHELAHVLYSSLPDFDRVQANLVSGWKVVQQRTGGDTWVTKPSRAHMAHDSENSPEEAFANNVEYYLFESTRTKVQAPLFHEWMDERYSSKMKLKRRAP